ncbi:hypothetical protein M977_02803 [Buttiauxella gaviniae ATCC 51604]|uniref:Uncharacterized protein n=1 Tax=Buttiauxella gaviniae ATCC 51604 TaxID=1354253 RepID=A0A1B7HV44_9ENTR|nr:hypothetical protein M977_02803 [Buttiauxella gaviniae ATCC 51604]
MKISSPEKQSGPLFFSVRLRMSVDVTGFISFVENWMLFLNIFIQFTIID